MDRTWPKMPDAYRAHAKDRLQAVLDMPELSVGERQWLVLRLWSLKFNDFLITLDNLHALYREQDFIIPLIADLLRLHAIVHLERNGAFFLPRASEQREQICRAFKHVLADWFAKLGSQQLDWHLMMGLNPNPVRSQGWRALVGLTFSEKVPPPFQLGAEGAVQAYMQLCFLKTSPLSELATRLDKTNTLLQAYLGLTAIERRAFLQNHSGDLHKRALLFWAITNHNHSLARHTTQLFPETLKVLRNEQHPLLYALEKRDRAFVLEMLNRLTQNDKQDLLAEYAEKYAKNDAEKLKVYYLARARTVPVLRWWRYIMIQWHQVMRFHHEDGLLQAVLDDKPNTILQLAVKGIEFDVPYTSYNKGFYEQTPLVMSVYRGHLAALKALLALSANPNCKMDRGETPLSIAAFNNRLLEAHALLMAGAQVNQANDALETPLIAAVKKNHVALVQLFIQFGANIHQRTRFGETPITIAASKGHTLTLALLHRAGASLNQDNWAGETLLITAIRKRHRGVLSYLLSFPAVKHQADKQGYHPILWATRMKEDGFIKLLQGHGFDVNQCDYRGDTALILAAKQGSSSRLELLLALNAQINQVNYVGNSALHVAVYHKHKEAVSLLLDAGIDKDQKNIQAYTALHLAVQAGDSVITELLLLAGASPFTRTAKGFDAIALAIQKNQLPILRQLIEKSHKQFFKHVPDYCALLAKQEAAFLQQFTHQLAGAYARQLFQYRWSRRSRAHDAEKRLIDTFQQMLELLRQNPHYHLDEAFKAAVLQLTLIAGQLHSLSEQWQPKNTTELTPPAAWDAVSEALHASQFDLENWLIELYRQALHSPHCRRDIKQGLYQQWRQYKSLGAQSLSETQRLKQIRLAFEEVRRAPVSPVFYYQAGADWEPSLPAKPLSPLLALWHLQSLGPTEPSPIDRDPKPQLK